MLHKIGPLVVLDANTVVMLLIAERVIPGETSSFFVPVQKRVYHVEALLCTGEVVRVTKPGTIDAADSFATEHAAALGLVRVATTVFARVADVVALYATKPHRGISSAMSTDANAVQIDIAICRHRIGAKRPELYTVCVVAVSTPEAAETFIADAFALMTHAKSALPASVAAAN